MVCIGWNYRDINIIVGNPPWRAYSESVQHFMHRASRKSPYTWFIYLFTPFYLHFYGSVLFLWAPSYLAQSLRGRHAFIFIFRGLCVFKEAKAPVTAACNSASVLRHTATLSSAIHNRLSPGVFRPDCVDAKRKTQFTYRFKEYAWIIW
jgi:hypothetical protein